MANDRIWLVCSACNEHTMLYKFYPGSCGYPGLDGYLADADRLEGFIEKHLRGCRPDLKNRSGLITLNGQVGFTLAVESDPDDETEEGT